LFGTQGNKEKMIETTRLYEPKDDGKRYLYILELDDATLTRSYGYEGGKMRTTTKTYKNVKEAIKKHNDILDDKFNEGYQVLKDELTSTQQLISEAFDFPEETPEEDTGEPVAELLDVDPDPDNVDTAPNKTQRGIPYKLARLMDHPELGLVFICRTDGGYRFKVEPKPRMPYKWVDCDVVYVDADRFGAFSEPLDPVYRGYSLEG
jgi:predicted DNA-binding WGR domain protein